MWWRSVIFTGLLFGTFSFLAINALWAILALIGKLAHWRIPYAPFGWAGLAVVVVLWGALAWGRLVGMWRVKVNEVVYRSKSVPEAFDGYRIVHISDLHVDTFDARPEALEKIVSKINALDADVILFTGDMQTGSMDAVYRHENALKAMKARSGVFSVLGNHDFFIYEKETREECLAAADSLADFERHLGWRVLRNTYSMISRENDMIAIAGVDNINGGQGFHTIQMGDLNAATDGLEGVFTILLSHDPSHWTSEVLPKKAANVTLSGHTHAAQVRLFGWSLANLSFNECDGRYDYYGRMLYVNAGIGCTAPFRIGCPSEITVITLKR